MLFQTRAYNGIYTATIGFNCFGDQNQYWGYCDGKWGRGEWIETERNRDRKTENQREGETERQTYFSSEFVRHSSSPPNLWRCYWQSQLLQLCQSWSSNHPAPAPTTPSHLGTTSCPSLPPLLCSCLFCLFTLYALQLLVPFLSLYIFAVCDNDVIFRVS